MACFTISVSDASIVCVFGLIFYACDWFAPFSVFRVSLYFYFLCDVSFLFCFNCLCIQIYFYAFVVLID